MSKTPSSINTNSQAAEQNPKLAYRPFGSQIQKASVAPVTQTDIEDEAFAEQKFEATGLELQAKYGKITPEGQERLTVLQAKMDGLLNSPLERATRFSHNFANIPIRSRDTATPIQAKLTIGEPGDKYEQEADETARQVVQRIHQPQSDKLQGESLPDEELQMKPMVQRRVSNGGMAATQDLEASINQVQGGGQPLAKNIRKPMELGFGADFSRVKVHTDTRADQLNRSIQAKAFTTGQDVFFRHGAYQPGSRGGQELIAHELTHVVQQRMNAIQSQQQSSTINSKMKPLSSSVEKLESKEDKGELIQRKVMIKNDLSETNEGNEYREKTKYNKYNFLAKGVKGREIEKMLTDDPVRYFDSKDELYKFAKDKTEKIGFVEKEKAWIRLENQLIVLGENHRRTTLTDIVNAVHTKKFMYEAYVEFPPEKNSEIEKIITEREKTFNKKMNLVDDNRNSHKAEDFYPKALRILYGFKSIDALLRAGDSELYLMKSARIVAINCDRNSGLYQIYQNNRLILDSLMNNNREQLENKENVTNWKIFTGFRTAFEKHAEEKIKQKKEKAKEEDRNNFDENWEVNKPDFSQDKNDPEMQAENARDFSMYQHIKQAKAKGYLLYGLGNLHRTRLEGVLDKEGIQHQEMDEFIEKQEKKYPQ
ncbi:eCIS core domain-containing protein [Nostoc sp.]|uniref:eCIS core domain-containing protein n=1 Tax=Nostoc sp. TaxID=1180 RepID=UPI002FF77BB3